MKPYVTDKHFPKNGNRVPINAGSPLIAILSLRQFSGFDRLKKIDSTGEGQPSPLCCEKLCTQSLAFLDGIDTLANAFSGLGGLLAGNSKTYLGERGTDRGLFRVSSYRL
jgi:hypothetical protein